MLIGLYEIGLCDPKAILALSSARVFMLAKYPLMLESSLKHVDVLISVCSAPKCVRGDESMCDLEQLTCADRWTCTESFPELCSSQAPRIF